MADTGSTVEAWGKAIASIAVAMVSLIYCVGYLTTRAEITTMGIPALAGPFDENYFYSGARFLIHLTAVWSQWLNIMVLAALVVIPLWRFLQRRYFRARRIGEWRRWRWSGVVLASFAIVVSLISINRSASWLGVRDLVFQTNEITNTDLREKAAVIAEPGNNTRAAAFQPYACAVLTTWALVIAAFACITVPRPLLMMAAAAAVVHFLASALVFGAVMADRERTKIRLGDGDTAWLLWEDRDSVFYVRPKAPAEIERRTRSKVEEFVVTGYERVLAGRAAQKRGN